jgi:ParB-like chromosome segregation protein Spo0J
VNYLVRAIKKIKPTAEFVFSNNDYSTIQWHILEGDAPTQAQIDAAIKAIEQEEAAAEIEAAAKKAAAEAKLATLGLTSDDLKALGLA